MSRSKGYIPKNIVVFTRPKATVNGHDCEPAFPVADRSVERGFTVVENAKRWARPNCGRTYSLSQVMAAKRQGITLPTEAEPDGITCSNKPQAGYRLVGAEQRGEGGRAWKVISPQGYLVDMREDVFLPILLTKGLPPSGIIDGKFQWCQAGSQLRLELVGSDAHKAYTPAHMVATEEANRKAASKVKAKARRAGTIPVKDLVVGGVYEFEVYGARRTRVYAGRARFRGKLKTVWIPFSKHVSNMDKAPTSTQGWVNYLFRRCQRDNQPVSVTLTTGSQARRRVYHQSTVTLPKDWRSRKLRFRRGDYAFFDRVYDDFDPATDITWK